VVLLKDALLDGDSGCHRKPFHSIYPSRYLL